MSGEDLQSVDAFLRNLGLQRYAQNLKQHNMLTVGDLKANHEKLSQYVTNALALQRLQAAITPKDADPPIATSDPLRDWERKIQEKLREVSRLRAKLVISRAGRMDVLNMSQEAERGNIALRLCHKALRLKERLSALRKEARRSGGGGTGGGSVTTDITTEAAELKSTLREVLQQIKDLPSGWGMSEFSSNPSLGGSGGGFDDTSSQRSTTPKTAAGDPENETPQHTPSPSNKEKLRSPAPGRTKSAAPRVYHQNPSGMYGNTIDPTPPASPSQSTARHNGIDTKSESGASVASSQANVEELFRRVTDLVQGKEKQSQDVVTLLRQTFTSLQQQIRSLQTHLQVLYSIQHTISKIDMRTEMQHQQQSCGGREISTQTDGGTLYGVACELACVVQNHCGTIATVPPPALLENIFNTNRTHLPSQWNTLLCYVKEVHGVLEESIKGNWAGCEDLDPLQQQTTTPTNSATPPQEEGPAVSTGPQDTVGEVDVSCDSLAREILQNQSQIQSVLAQIRKNSRENPVN